MTTTDTPRTYPRKQLEAALKTILPERMTAVDIAHPMDPATTNPGGWIVVEPAKVRPARHDGEGYHETYFLWLVVGYGDAEIAEAALDVAIHDVLPLLDREGWLVWTEAERFQFQSKLSSYRITVELFTGGK